MAGDFRHVRSGDPLRIPAATYNAVLDATKAVQASGLGQRGLVDGNPWDRGVILVKNATGAERAQFDALSLGTPVIAPDDNLSQWQSRPVLSGVAPAAGLPWCILLEPLAANAIGRALVSGIAPVQIDMQDAGHRHATIEPDTYTQLTSAGAGAAEILWVAGTAGVQHALVRLGNDGGPLWVRIVSEGSDSVTCEIPAAGGWPTSAIEIDVAKPPNLRGAVAERPAEAPCWITPTGDPPAEFECTITAQHIEPRYCPGGHLLVQWVPALEQWVDTNIDARHWEWGGAIECEPASSASSQNSSASSELPSSVSSISIESSSLSSSESEVSSATSSDSSIDSSLSSLASEPSAISSVSSQDSEVSETSSVSSLASEPSAASSASSQDSEASEGSSASSLASEPSAVSSVSSLDSEASGASSASSLASDPSAISSVGSQDSEVSETSSASSLASEPSAVSSAGSQDSEASETSSASSLASEPSAGSSAGSQDSEASEGSSASSLTSEPSTISSDTSERSSDSSKSSEPSTESSVSSRESMPSEGSSGDGHESSVSSEAPSSASSQDSEASEGSSAGEPAGCFAYMEPPIDGTTEYFGGGANFPAGNYEVRYISGAVAYRGLDISQPEETWGICIPPGSNGPELRVTTDGANSLVQLAHEWSNFGLRETVAEVEEMAAGWAWSFEHDGGPIGLRMQLEGTEGYPPAGFVNSDPPIRFLLCDKDEANEYFNCDTGESVYLAGVTQTPIKIGGTCYEFMGQSVNQPTSPVPSWEAADDGDFDCFACQAGSALFADCDTFSVMKRLPKSYAWGPDQTIDGGCYTFFDYDPAEPDSTSSGDCSCF